MVEIITSAGSNFHYLDNQYKSKLAEVKADIAEGMTQYVRLVSYSVASHTVLSMHSSPSLCWQLEKRKEAALKTLVQVDA